MLSLEAISIELAGKTIVSDFSLALAPGQCAALFGPSGCGKTTILRAIGGLTALKAGRIINNSRRCAYLFQEPRLLPWLTVLDNVRLVRPAVAEAQIFTLLERLGLERRDGAKYPGELSGGMAQRVALARALIIEPDLLLMDEPFSALDLSLRRDLQQHIATLLAAGLAVVLVSHDSEEVALLARDIYGLGGRPARLQEHIQLTRPLAARDRAWLGEQLRRPLLAGRLY